ncbi:MULTISPECIES: Fe-S cluster assembly protein HesB [Microbacterium]|uniref:Fe-S cluster assembly protein HesB n=1 Tax=Microbacterium galbinum TaxID=2851646 RepID=A0ABY4IU06_9MICO|nr:Fe-S cluster assembly protein HesB [Microbacterium galbinum]MCK2022300.1 Fe-S cluster assembly protein HesB [Microbacterium galbinum]MCK2029084.1 Fe-S cluster assembly protein HesB [Microbacterium galbinum]UPL15125.1 Fe-S cluster assembly protein HesB [Microbacterium galbinum]
MLTLTDNASAIVTTLVSRQSEAPDAGLRIHSTEAQGPSGESRLAVLVTTDPEPQDQVVEISGTRLFLDETAAVALDDKILDAGVDDEGAVSFAVLPQVA